MAKHTRLTHIDALNNYQFITFRTAASVDSYVKKIMNETNTTTSQIQYNLDKYLDRSQNGAILNNTVLSHLHRYLLLEDQKLYDLVSFCIMPNHVHILFKQLKPLDTTIKTIKGKSAIEINKILGSSGKFWASEYFDKVIRDEKHFDVVYRYIQNNPIKAGLIESERFYSKYLS
jgi:REP element-mobilizing transposase RayT